MPFWSCISPTHRLWGYLIPVHIDMKFEKGEKCQDINECLNNVCSGIFECSNTDGSYACNCPIGYEMINDECIVTDFSI